MRAASTATDGRKMAFIQVGIPAGLDLSFPNPCVFFILLLVSLFVGFLIAYWRTSYGQTQYVDPQPWTALWRCMDAPKATKKARAAAAGGRPS